MIELSASLLSADFARLGAVVAELCELGIRRIHIDVMDGHFVPNLAIGPQVVRSLRPIADRHGAHLNAHLMIEEPERFVGTFADAGAHGITVHVETGPVAPVLAAVRARGLDAGVALSPGTPIARVVDVLGHVDWCLVMTVHPGFGGQRLIPACLDKVRQLSGRGTRIAVDGGVNDATIAEVAKAGADVAVVGSGLFQPGASVAHNLARLRDALAKGHRT